MSVPSQDLSHLPHPSHVCIVHGKHFDIYAFEAEFQERRWQGHRYAVEARGLPRRHKANHQRPLAEGQQEPQSEGSYGSLIWLPVWERKPRAWAEHGLKPSYQQNSLVFRVLKQFSVSFCSIRNLGENEPEQSLHMVLAGGNCHQSMDVQMVKIKHQQFLLSAIDFSEPSNGVIMLCNLREVY